MLRRRRRGGGGGVDEGGGGNVYTHSHTHTPQTFIAEFTLSVEYDHLQPQYILISWHTCVLSM
jgi:hypothetical protein